MFLRTAISRRYYVSESLFSCKYAVNVQVSKRIVEALPLTLFCQFMRTNIPDIFSAGDVASFPLTIRGDQRVNVGHWQMSQSHGERMKDSKKHSFIWCLLGAWVLLRYLWV